MADLHEVVHSKESLRAAWLRSLYAEPNHEVFADDYKKYPKQAESPASRKIRRPADEMVDFDGFIFPGARASQRNSGS
jgi:hypothetical protein